MSKINEQAYFFVLPGQHSRYRATLCPDKDVAPLTRLSNAIQVYPTNAGEVPGYLSMKLICCIISQELQADLKDIAETDDWASLETVLGIDIVGKYAGRDLSYTPNWGVFENHPGLDKQVQIGVDAETGEQIMHDIVNRIEWP